MKPKEILEIEKYYNIELTQIIENDNEYSKVTFYKNKNSYSLNSKNEIEKINLKDNYLGDLNGLEILGDTITHLNLAATRIDKIDVLAKFYNVVFLDLSTNSIKDINSIKKIKEIREFIFR